MSFLTDLQYILSPEFIWSNSYLEERSVSMRVDLANDGCQVLIFQLDKPLDKSYKGGLYPFFNRSNSNVCKACDYILFSQCKSEYFAIAIELKRGNSHTSYQLDAGLSFANFVIDTVNRVKRKNYKVNMRKISIKDSKRKRKTKMKDIEYDANLHHVFEQNRFRTISFLK